MIEPIVLTLTKIGPQPFAIFFLLLSAIIVFVISRRAKDLDEEE